MIDTVLQNGPSGNRVDIVVIGDGYRAPEVVTTFRSDVDALAGYMFGGGRLTEPFNRYASFFNLHRVELVSAESGADDGLANIGRDTALDAAYAWDGRTERLLYVDEAKTDAVLAKALMGTGIDRDLSLVAVNSSAYGGGAGEYAVFAAGHALAWEIAMHEIGHVFAGLADEYGGYRVHYLGAEPSEANITKDPSGAKWDHWIGYTQPGIGRIDAYEGGRYADFGLYRPSVNSKMRELERPFDAVAREQIVLKIYEEVDPIDWHTDNAVPLVGAGSLVVQVVDPAVIRIEWSVQGVEVLDGSVATFALSDHGYGVGSFSVVARAYDDTDWVRIGREALEQRVEWTVETPTGATEGDDFVVGTNAMDRLLGRGGDDWLLGGRGNDALLGGIGDDVLVGGKGDDTLVGGEGEDTLAGGPGADVHRIRSPAEGVDLLIGFESGRDTIEFAAREFGGGLRPGALPSARFEAAADPLATRPFGQFLYGEEDGSLVWDADGTGPAEGVLIAILRDAPTLDAQDIQIIA